MEDLYDIRFNRQEPSSEEIAAHQDFDALMAAFEENPERKTAVIVPMRAKRRPYFAVAAAIALLLAAYPVYQILTKSTLPDETTFFAARPFVDPPATANIPDLIAEVVVNPETEQEIALDDGQLVLSSTALFRDRGKSIGKPVQVHYRQLDEVADYFMAGLPLNYKAEGNIAQLDAAVVLDIHATAAGKPVKIAAGESVAIELNTTINNDGEDYRIYQLDTNSRQWIDAGPLNSKQIAQNNGWPEDMPEVKQYQEIEQRYDRQIAAAEQTARNNSQLPERPTPPQRQAGKNPTLELDFLNQTSLADGSTVSPQDLGRINKGGIWELLPETGSVDVRAFNVEWNSVRLRELPNEKYELTLINPQKEEKLIIRPIMLDDGDFFQAQQRYEAELEAYEAAIAAAAGDQENDEVNKLKLEKENALNELSKQIMANVEAMPLAEQQRLQQRRANFKFAISSWGIYAVAKQIKDLPQLSSVAFSSQPAIDDEQSARVYYTDGKHKTLYKGLVRKDNSRLPLDQDNTSARIWIVNEQGELVIANVPQGTVPALNGNVKLNTSEAQPLPSSAALLRQKLILE